jgi:hypothetical protein
MRFAIIKGYFWIVLRRMKHEGHEDLIINVIPSKEGIQTNLYLSYDYLDSSRLIAGRE